MRESPLVTEMTSQGAPLEDYRGVSLARFLGEPLLNADLLRHSVLLYDWSWKGRLRVSGPDARKWLNGMLSANVRDLAPNRVVPSFQLDPKGHILATMEIACLEPESFLLLSDESQLPALRERLQRYVFISKLSLDAEPGEALVSLALRGRPALDRLRRLQVSPLPVEPGLRTRAASPLGPLTLVLHQPGGVDMVELILEAERMPALWSWLCRAEAIPAGAATQERDRVLSGEPRFGVDIRGSELPQETGQLRALDFTKGCYVGQEIVERIRSRGSVHRHFRAFRLQRPVPPGSPILVAGREEGVVTSLTGWEDGVAALGYVRRPHDAPGTEFIVAGVPGQVRHSSSFYGND